MVNKQININKIFYKINMSNISNLTRNDKFGAWFDKINAIIDYLNVFSVDKDNIPPLKHDSDKAIYGVGNNANYGHVMLSDVIDKEYNTEHGIASTPYATKRAYDKAMEAVGVAENSLSKSTINSEKIIELESELQEISGEIINHASEKETYGIGTKSLYGHLKLSDSINSAFSESSGVAATPYAIKITHELAQNTLNLVTSDKTGLTTKAPLKHNSTEDIYGLGNKTEYGHLKVTDDVSDDDAVKAIAISPKAVKDIKTSLLSEINNSKNSITSLEDSLLSISNSINEKASKNHATTYGENIGIATEGVYGHVLLSDFADDDKNVSSGTAVTPKALNTVKNNVTEINNTLDIINTKLDGGGSTIKFLRGDGVWAVPNETAYIGENGIKISNNTISLATYGIAGSYGSEANQTPNFGEDFNVTYISTDSYGRTTAQTKTVTIPNTLMIGATDSTSGQSGLVPAPNINNKSHFLRGDGTWASPEEITFSIMSGASATSDGQSGFVPTPTTEGMDYKKFLRGDGTWASPNIMIGADDEGDGVSGLVPIPLFENGDYDKYLRGDGTWDTPPDTKYSVMTGASMFEAGTSGLVPAPGIRQNYNLLRGDGTWVTPLNAIQNMVGCDLKNDGEAGLVPAPVVGDRKKFLRGDGIWATVPVTSVNGETGDVTISSGVPVGTVIACANTTTPDGYIYCDGSSLNKNTYSELFAKIGYRYGGSGDYFNIPNTIDKFIQGANSAANNFGTILSAGLPNITGSFDLLYQGRTSSAVVTGAFSASNSQFEGAHNSYGTGVKISFNANSSNSIYGSSTTVQPPAIVLKYYIKY